MPKRFAVSEVFRKDMRFRLDNPYRRAEKYPSDTKCPQCGLLFLKGVWRWAATEPSHELQWKLCPACQQIRDDYPGGLLRLSGGFIARHREEILNRRMRPQRFALHAAFCTGATTRFTCSAWPRSGMCRRSKQRNVRERSVPSVSMYRRQMLSEMKRILQQAQETLRAEGIQAEVLMEMGSPAEVIVRLAADYAVTAVGAHGRYETTKPGLGPVASRVVEYAPGTVLVAREMIAETSFQILLALDGSLASEHALHTMASCFNIGSSEITLMHVVETPWIPFGLDRERLEYGREAFDQADPGIQLERELRLEAEEIIESARKRLAPYGVSTRTIVAEGIPASEILREAESGDCDLIVLGATGVTDMKHEMLGSVSTKVAWNAPCSVSVIKDTD